MGVISRTLPIIRMVTLILHGLTMLFQSLPPVRHSRCGDGSNRLTNNINYRMFLFCIGAAFENKRRVDPLASILCSHRETGGVITTLSDLGLLRLGFHFEPKGSQIIERRNLDESHYPTTDNDTRLIFHTLILSKTLIHLW